MNTTDALGLVLQLAAGLLGNLKGTVPKETLEQLQNAQAALAKVQEFHGTLVTNQQLDSLRG